MHTNDSSHEFIRPAEVAGEFGAGLTEQRLRQLRWLRVGPAYCKAGKSIFYRRSDVAAWLERNTVDPSKATADDRHRFV